MTLVIMYKDPKGQTVKGGTAGSVLDEGLKFSVKCSADGLFMMMSCLWN